MLYLNKPLENGFFKGRLFNFNKCCIWIVELLKKEIAILKFNFNKCCIWMQK